MRRLLLSLPLVCLGCGGSADVPPPAGQAPASAGAVPAAAAPVPDSRIREAIRSGAAFLLKTQHKDGAWGSHDPIEGFFELGFGQIDQAAQDSVRNAVTALCARSLLELPEPTPETTRSARRGVEFLLENWKTGYGGNAFNTWGLAWTLDLFAGFVDRSEFQALRPRLRTAIPEVIRSLLTVQMHQGGWAYYSGPGCDGKSASFTTATALLALVKAKQAGFAVPKGAMEDGLKMLERLRLGDGNFLYSADQLLSVEQGPLVPLGAGSRTQAGTLALHELGAPEGAPSALARKLDDFLATADYLEIGRKRITPHRDAPHLISGYFFFYGYYYAAQAAACLPVKDHGKYWKPLAADMLRTQEKNGSWWDTICYDYGDKWGTAFALLTLEQTLKDR